MDEATVYSAIICVRASHFRRWIRDLQRMRAGAAERRDRVSPMVSDVSELRFSEFRSPCTEVPMLFTARLNSGACQARSQAARAHGMVRHLPGGWRVRP